MKTLAAVSLALVLLSFAAARAADPDKKDSKDKKAASGKGDAVTILARDIQWGDAPPDLPKGAKLAVMHGDPSKKDVFSVRLKLPQGYKVPPHWHTKDEQLTILSGTFVLHMGDTMDAPAHELGAGAYHFLPGKMHHAAEVKDEVILQVDGTGPFDIHYLNPADNPNKSAALTK
jgi:hypothetical protein